MKTSHTWCIYIYKYYDSVGKVAYELKNNVFIDIYLNINMQYINTNIKDKA